MTNTFHTQMFWAMLSKPCVVHVVQIMQIMQIVLE